MNYHYTLIKMDKEKKNSDNTKHWQENRETKPLIYLVQLLGHMVFVQLVL